jgi:hypothetical protein
MFNCIICGSQFLNAPSQPVCQLAVSPAEVVKAEAAAMLLEIADELAEEGDWEGAFKTLKSRIMQERKLVEVYRE